MMGPPDGRRPQQPEEERDSQAADDLDGMFYQPSANQGRHEPMPASHDDEGRQEAVRQNEAYAHGTAGRHARTGQGEVPGDLTPGPEDPATPPTQVTSGQPGDGRAPRVRRVSRAAPGRPDGEVDPDS